jgi:hypothetical protein
MRVFLSASVPLPDRHPRFMATADVVAIREAVKALVAEVIPRGLIVFGGHPAITPLMALLLRGMGTEAAQRIILYQSAFFADQFLQAIDDFLEVRVIPAIANSRERSLGEMRNRMIGDTHFDAGVFIGGMEGVLDEYELFRATHQGAECWPIASTGAAALELFERDRTRYPNSLARELTYSTLFRQLLSKIERE